MSVAEELVVSVTFPPSHHAVAQRAICVVFERDEKQNTDEVVRLDGQIRYEGNRAILTVPKPKARLNYGISWQSPRGSELVDVRRQA